MLYEVKFDVDFIWWYGKLQIKYANYDWFIRMNNEHRLFTDL